MTPISDIATAKVIASSIFDNGVRVDTLQLRYPRMIHSELMTHRDFSRNGASSRAIPIASVLARDEVYIPQFRKNRPGMQPAADLSTDEQAEAERLWMTAVDACRDAARAMADKGYLNIHKEHPNRMLEWFSWIDVLVTSTRWSNWDGLRRHPDAQGEIRSLAERMFEAREAFTPARLKGGQWHTPYITEQDREDVARMVRDQSFTDDVREVLGLLLASPRLRYMEHGQLVLMAISAARACRVSYAKTDGSPTTIADDMKRYMLLASAEPLHASPLEHQCRGLTFWDEKSLQGNLVGTVQFRKLLPNEVM